MKTLSVSLIVLILALTPVEKKLVLAVEDIADKAFNKINNSVITARDEMIVDQYKTSYNIKCKVDEDVCAHTGLNSNYQLPVDALYGPNAIYGLW